MPKKPAFLAADGAETLERVRSQLRDLLATDGRKAALAAQLGVPQAQVNKWLDRGLQGWAVLYRICGALGISADELLGLPTPDHPEPPADPSAPIPQAWVPLVADVAAGEAAHSPREEAEDWYAFKAKWVAEIARRHGTPPELLFAVKVLKGRSGESMLPTIRPGASLVVDPGPKHSGLTTIDNGRIYVCRPGDGDGWTVKRAWLAGGRYLVLKGDNPEHPAIVEDMRGRRLRDVVVGKVVYIGQEEG